MIVEEYRYICDICGKQLKSASEFTTIGFTTLKHTPHSMSSKGSMVTVDFCKECFDRLLQQPILSMKNYNPEMKGENYEKR